MDKRVTLKPGKEKSLNQKHPWIFSGAIDRLPMFENGDILPVYSADNAYLATAYFHNETSIAGRVISFDKEDVTDALKLRLQQAIYLREQLFDKTKTNAYRLVNAEGDNLPGLIIDVYNGVFVIQISTAGMEKLKALLVGLLVDLCKPDTIFEKSVSSSREKEGLPPREGLLYGKNAEEVEILENGCKFIVPIAHGQKTGFFLDQREMRKMVGSYSKDKKVLNCFSYTGGFSLYALNGGAAHLTTVDSSSLAIDTAKRNFALNGFDPKEHAFIEEDAFSFLRESSMDFGLAILDPPAFCKKRSDIPAACRGYKEINRLVIEKLPPNSFLLTSSCSYFLEPSLFSTLIFQASYEAGRSVQVLHSHTQAPDHPVSVFHPEGNYLKSLFLFIN